MSLSTYTKAPLSASPFGRSIAVTGTTLPGALIHIPSFSQLDEIYLYAQNNGASALTVNVLWGGTTVYDLMQAFLVPQSGRVMLTDGKLLTGTGTIGAYLSTPGTVSIDGFVNRIVPGIDQRVVDWANRVVASGGATPSVNTQQVLSVFIQALTSSGLLQKMEMVNCFVPDSLIACLTPLIKGTGYDSWINHNFVSGDVTVNGITGDAATKYADTGIQSASAFGGVTTSVGLTLYCIINPQPATTGNVEDLLAFDSGSNQLALLLGFNGQSYFDAYWEVAGAGRVVANNPAFRGYISGNYGTLDGSIKEAIYIASPLIGHSTLISDVSSTSGAVSNFKIFFGTGNQSGTPVATSYSSRTYSFAAAHYGLKAAESQTFFALIQAMRQSLGGGFIPSDAVQDWVNRVVLNGGAIPSASTQIALSTFYNGLVSTGLISKMKVIAPIVPDSLTAALTPFWNRGGFDPWINHNFVIGDLTVNGLIGNGSSKYLETGMVASINFDSINDGGLTAYVAANSTNISESEFGGGNGSTQNMNLYTNFGGTSYMDMFTQTDNAGRIHAVNTSFTGYISANHGTLGGGIIEAIYTGNSGAGHATLVNSSTSVGGTLPTQQIFAMAQNGNGTPIQHTIKRMSFFAVHNGLTPTESSNFYTLVQALRTALGGGFV